MWNRCAGRRWRRWGWAGKEDQVEKETSVEPVRLVFDWLVEEKMGRLLT